MGIWAPKKIFWTSLVRKTWILDLWDGGLGGGCFRARPLGGGVRDTPPTTPPPLGLPIDPCLGGRIILPPGGAGHFFYSGGLTPPRGRLLWEGLGVGG